MVKSNHFNFNYLEDYQKLYLIFRLLFCRGDPKTPQSVVENSSNDVFFYHARGRQQQNLGLCDLST